MSNLDKEVSEAFIKPYQRPQTTEEPSFDTVYQLKNGQQIQSEASKLDQDIYWKWQRKEDTLQESEKSLSTDNKIQAAFS